MSRNHDCKVVDGVYVCASVKKALKRPNNRGECKLEITYYGGQVVEVTPALKVGDCLDILTGTDRKEWKTDAFVAHNAVSYPFTVDVERNANHSAGTYCDISGGCGTFIGDQRHQGPWVMVQCKVR